MRISDWSSDVCSSDLFWMVTNSGVFFNSMDYRYRPVSYTPSRTRVDRDGKIRIILSHDDCGYHNWLDTQGFARGNLTYRAFLSSAATSFRTQLVKRDALAAALPSDSAPTRSEDRSVGKKCARTGQSRWCAFTK